MDVLGHAAIRSRLEGALKRGTLHHALLFEGPSGVGKRLVAEWVARVANCTGANAPCEECPSCRQIAAGSFPDVIRVEPDPEKASQTIGVDQIREVVRLSGYHRYSGKRRVVILDPAEALLPAAANALLKTLEEPPEGTGFILVTHHASALLPTILSRCQRVRFGPVPEAELAAWLKGKGLDEPEALARRAQGCPGRALQLSEGGLTERIELREMLLNTLAGDLGGLFEGNRSLVEGEGRQTWRPRVDRLLEVLEDLLRDVVVLGSGSSQALVNEDHRTTVERWAAVLWPGGIMSCERAIAEARDNLDANVGGRVVLDALLARMRGELGAARKR